jgi:hypothetical protein
MLFDPKWEVEIQADPFSRENLIAWLEKQPADTVYCFADFGHCLLAQWLASMDANVYQPERRGTGYEYVVHGRRVDLIDFRLIAWHLPHTFGAALERARSAASASRT